jgi:hypothetical protein
MVVALKNVVFPKQQMVWSHKIDIYSIYLTRILNVSTKLLKNEKSMFQRLHSDIIMEFKNRLCI